jgi:hypothetical protein
MNRRAKYLLALLLSSVSVSFVAATNGGDPKRSRNATADSSQYVEAREEKWERDPVVFSARDRDAIRIYYRGATSNLTVGQRKGNGHHLRNHLQRNGLLLPGLQNQLESLSNDLERRLQPLYSGYVRGMIGNDIVIVESRTLRIMDVIRDVTGHR